MILGAHSRHGIQAAASQGLATHLDAEDRAADVFPHRHHLWASWRCAVLFQSKGPCPCPASATLSSTRLLGSDY